MREKIELKRTLSLFDTSLLVIGSVLGSGIFLTTGHIAGIVPSVGWIMVVWLAGGLISLFGALTFAELGAALPRSGGQFVYLKECYGSSVGFLYGWAFFLVIQCGGIAALAVGFTEYLGYFFPPFSNDSQLFRISLSGFKYSLSSGQIVAFFCIALLSAINYRGIKWGSFLQNIFTLIKILSIAFLVILGFYFGKKSGQANWSSFFSNSHLSLGAIFKFLGLGLVAAMWSYDGWYAVNCTAEEIKNVRRNLPLGLIIGIISIISIYSIVNVVYIVALPFERMKGVTRIAETAITTLFGAQASFWGNFLILVTIFGCLSSTVIYGPRVFYAMAQSGLFFRKMSLVHPSYRTPHIAIIGQGIWSGILCLTGSYKALYEYVVFALVLFFAATGLGIVILRRKKPELSRPYRAWGYPYLPIIFITANLWIFLNTFFQDLGKSLIGLLLILLGFPAYFYWKKKDNIYVAREQI